MKLKSIFMSKRNIISKYETLRNLAEAKSGDLVLPQRFTFWTHRPCWHFHGRHASVDLHVTRHLTLHGLTGLWFPGTRNVSVLIQDQDLKDYGSLFSLHTQEPAPLRMLITSEGSRFFHVCWGLAHHHHLYKLYSNKTKYKFTNSIGGILFYKLFVTFKPRSAWPVQIRCSGVKGQLYSYLLNQAWLQLTND